jgi:hypothetical protein
MFQAEIGSIWTYSIVVPQNNQMSSGSSILPDRFTTTTAPRHGSIVRPELSSITGNDAASRPERVESPSHQIAGEAR